MKELLFENFEIISITHTEEFNHYHNYNRIITQHQSVWKLIDMRYFFVKEQKMKKADSTKKAQEKYERQNYPYDRI